MEWIRRIPLPICGLTLGLAALGNLLLPYSLMLRWLYGGLATVLYLCLLAKILCYPQLFWQEMSTPLGFSVFQTFFMTLLQFSNYYAAYLGPIALGMWFFSSLGHLVLITVFTWKYVRRLHLKDVYPTWFVLYGGNMLAGLTSPAFQMEWLGVWIFWFGLIIFLPVVPLVMYRCLKLPLQNGERPTLCIFTAPTNLAIASYLAVTAHPSVTAVILMELLAHCFYLFVLWKLPSLLRTSFAPSYGAFTFPFVITAVAMRSSLEFLTLQGVAIPAFLYGFMYMEIAMAVIMVNYALLRYLMYLFHKQKEPQVEAA